MLMVRHHDQSRRPTKRTGQTELQVHRLESGQAFIEDNEIRILKQGACDVDTTLLAVRKLPTDLSDKLRAVSAATRDY
jgi:hypothetical protein